ncbi:hypothetical protein BBRP734_01696 [Bifidobacterium breve]|nr:hypothetical protein BBRP734_01696 [Bifidobacterium breve]
MLGSLNSWKLPMIEKITVMASEPFSSGSLMDLTICHSEAPSMEAASYRECGMVDSDE